MIVPPGSVHVRREVEEAGEAGEEEEDDDGDNEDGQDNEEVDGSNDLASIFMLPMTVIT